MMTKIIKMNLVTILLLIMALLIPLKSVSAQFFDPSKVDGYRENISIKEINSILEQVTGFKLSRAMLVERASYMPLKAGRGLYNFLLYSPSFSLNFSEQNQLSQNKTLCHKTEYFFEILTESAFGTDAEKMKNVFKNETPIFGLTSNLQNCLGVKSWVRIYNNSILRPEVIHELLNFTRNWLKQKNEVAKLCQPDQKMEACTILNSWLDKNEDKQFTSIEFEPYNLATDEKLFFNAIIDTNFSGSISVRFKTDGAKYKAVSLEKTDINI